MRTEKHPRKTDLMNLKNTSLFVTPPSPPSELHQIYQCSIPFLGSSDSPSHFMAPRLMSYYAQSTDCNAGL